MSEYFHTVIVGAGAAGLFCAGSFPAEKLVLEANAKAGVKVSVSGGGKCNFTNRFTRAQDYVSQHKHFCKSALSAFGPQDFVQLLRAQNIPFEERANGQLFARSAPEIVRFLVRRAQRQNSEIRLNTRVLRIAQTPGGFTVFTSRASVQARHVVLACGGVSCPSLGSSNFGAQTAAQFGLPIVPQRPALCGLIWPKEYRAWGQLAGNCLEGQVTCEKHTFSGPVLFTHEGISGPAVLNASLFWQDGAAVCVNFLPGTDALSFWQARKEWPKTLSGALVEKLSPKITKTLLGPLDKRLPDISKHDLCLAAQRVNRFCFVPRATAGYTKAEVMAGGVDTGALNPSTLEVKTVRGLYMIGEMVDVTGRLGGFNLQWAWSAGYAAGLALKG